MKVDHQKIMERTASQEKEKRTFAGDRIRLKTKL
jgi:hypothetical protein